jgi:hypothetical protein
MQVRDAEVMATVHHRRTRRFVGGSCVVRMQTHGNSRARPLGIQLTTPGNRLVGSLAGATLNLPQGFGGFVLRKPRADAHAARQWQTEACFNEVT